MLRENSNNEPEAHWISQLVDACLALDDLHSSALVSNSIHPKNVFYSIVEKGHPTGYLYSPAMCNEDEKVLDTWYRLFPYYDENEPIATKR